MEKRVIVISGQPGSGSSTTGKLLAKDLGLDYFSVGRIDKDIALGTYKDKFYFKELERLSKKYKIIIPDFNAKNDTEAMDFIWNSDFGKSTEYHNLKDELQIELAKRGDIVIDGKLAIHMIEKATLKIWLKADFEARIKRTVERDGVSLDEAKRMLGERQDSERREWKIIYGFDPWDQEKEADLVIDTTNTDAEKVFDIIIKKMVSQKL